VVGVCGQQVVGVRAHQPVTLCRCEGRRSVASAAWQSNQDQGNCLAFQHPSGRVFRRTAMPGTGLYQLNAATAWVFPVGVLVFAPFSLFLSFFFNRSFQPESFSASQ